VTTIARDSVEDLKRTLPGRYYFEPAVHDLEAERIFERTWINVGHGSRIAKPGDFFTVQAGRQGVLVVRGADGVARAFLNSCRHRGTAVCSIPSGNAGTSFQCPYHLWTYRLDGSLAGAPMSDDIEGFDRRDFGLVPVALEEWLGFLWINTDPAAGPLADYAGPMVEERLGDQERLAVYRTETFVLARSVEYDVAANWKLVVENFMECYHCTPVHPNLVRIIPAFKLGVTQVPTLGTEFAPEYEAFTMSGHTDHPMLPGLPENHRRHFYGMVIRPNTFVSLTPHYVVIHRVEPLAADRSKVTCDWLYPPSTASAPRFDPSDAVQFVDEVNREDWLFPTEAHIRGFSDWVLEQLDE
jgi:Rieske 2Fe-2S family protein